MRCLLLLFLQVNISITIAVTVARVIGSQTSTATIVSLTLRLKLLRQATRFFSTVSKISLSIGLVERPGRTIINQNLKNYEEDFSPLHEVYLVLACAMFGALSIILIEDLNVGGSFAFLGIGAGTLIWDTKF